MHNKPDQLQLRQGADLQPVNGARLEPTFLIPNAAAAISLAIKMVMAKRGESGKADR
jgi:hypothetical protein